jgi:hypothetical protein
MDLTGSATAVVLGFPAILMIGMLAMNRVERIMSGRRTTPPELHLVLGEGSDPAGDAGDSCTDPPALRLVVGSTSPDDLH